MTTLVGPKNTSLTTLTGVYTFDVVFTQVDFQAASGYANLQGPLSVAVDVDNQTVTPLYFGIIVETNNGVVTIADKLMPAFIGPLTHATISAASVPPLGYIDGVVTKITIRYYRFDTTGAAGTSIITALKIDPPATVFAATPTFGRDSTVLEPASYDLAYFGYDQVVAANTNNVAIVTMLVVPAPFRYRVTGIILIAGITPSYPADIKVYAQIVAKTTAISDILVLYSLTDQLNTMYFPIDKVLGTGDQLRIRADNRNASVAYTAGAVIFAESIY